jgi:ABC-type dipeptide/oligopeptide/nickel transport system permease component
VSRYVVQRVLHTLVVLFGVALLTFVIVHMTPGDPVLVILGTDATPGELERLRRLLGLDQPLPVQFAQYLSRLATGQMGESIFQHQPVTKLIGDRIPATLELALAAMLIATFVGLITGIISALFPYSPFDVMAMLLALSGVAIPVFWLGMLAILLFALQLGWLPSFGRGEPLTVAVANWIRYGDPFDVVDSVKHLILPALTLGAFSAALISRLVRSALLEVLGQDYIRTARAKGLWQKLILSRHALKNAMLPVLTVIALEFAFLMGGLVVTEQVFNLNGLGMLFVESVARRDYTLTQALVMLVAFVFIFVNFAVDLMYAWLDPRIRFR